MVDILDILTMKNAFRMLIFVLLFGYVMFSLLLMFRVRILADTLKTQKSPFVSFLAKVHFIVVIIGSIVVGILVLF